MQNMSRKRNRHCCIEGCINYLGTKSDDFDFFRIPRDEQIKGEWIEQIMKHQELHNITERSSLCNLHFPSDCFVNKGKLSPIARPSIFPTKNCEAIEESNGRSDFNTFCPSRNENSQQEIQNMNPVIQTDLERKLLDRIISLEKELLKANNQIGKLNKKLSDQNKKIQKVKSRYSTLKVKEKQRQKNEKKSGLNGESLKILECLKIGRKNSQTYSEAIRSFAITFHFYSPRAYKFVRDKFNKHLPNETTLRKWYANCTYESEPGISKEGMRALGSLANDFKNEGKQLIVSIAFDEISIRRLVQWSDAKKKFLGYITYGRFVGEVPVARNALVFLLTAMNADFSLPIAYYFVIALNATERASLIDEIVTKISKLGVKVAAITFDGLRANFSACEVLNASFNVVNPKPFILNPVDSSKIHIFLDACHMLKLARNCIASETFLHDRLNNEMISWLYFEKLESCRVRKDFVCHKLTKKHVQWHRAKMDVRLAAETLSDSVADAMEHLMKEGVKSFEHCEGTIKYIRIMNKLFDIFNSKKEKPNLFKSPVTIVSKRIIFDFLDEADRYLRSLTLKGRSILLSRKSTAFKGMLFNIISLKNIVSEYLDTELLENIPTFRMSQDLLETLFGRIRSLNGNNDNPSVEQFSSALRKILIHNEIVSSDLSNCSDQLTILTVSSFKQKESEVCVDEGNDQVGETEEIAHFMNDPFCENDYLQNVFEDSTIVRMANEIETKIKMVARFDCDNCMEILNDNQEISSDFHKYRPCFSTILIGKVVFKFVNIFKNKKNLDYQILLETILKNIDKKNIFPNFNCGYEHKDYFVSFIAQEFIRMRAVYIAKTSTLMEQKKMLRKKYRKTIHFSGQ